MNPYLLLSATAFIFNGAMLLHISFRRKKTPLNGPFLLMLCFIECWVLFNGVFKLRIYGDWLVPMFKANSVFWLSIGFLFLNFTYAFIDKKKDWAYYVFFVLNIAGVVVSVSTNLVVQGYSRDYWGANQTTGPLFLPFTLLIVILPIILSLSLIAREKRNITEDKRLGQLNAFFWGSFISVLLGSAFAVILPDLLNLGSFVQLTAETSVVFTAIMFWAIARYDFLSLGIKNIAANLFVHLQDVIIILDENDRITQANQAAARLLRTPSASLCGKDISTVIKNYRSVPEDYQDYELQADCDGETRTFLSSQVTVREKGVCLGKILILRDITDRIRAENELRESEERYRRLVDASPEAIIVHDGVSILFINAAGARMFGAEQPEKFFGQPITDFVHPDYRSLVIERARKAKVEKIALPLMEEKFLRVDGTSFDVEVVAIPTTYQGKECVQVIARDISERVKAEKALRESEERYRTLFNLSPDGVVLAEARENEAFWPIVDCNEAFCKMNGYERDELIGKSIDIFHPDQATVENHNRVLERLRRERFIHQEVVHKRKDGTEFFIDNVMNLVVISGRELILGIDRDMTDRKRAEETIRYQIYHDLLTGLPNRTLFGDRLSLALANSRRNGGVLAVIFLNLDRFKTINDTLGHAVGDRLLQLVAERLSGCLSEGDTLARLSGDSFTLLLPQVERIEDVAKLAREIQESFKFPFLLSGMDLYLTVSMGIALYPNDGEDVDTLLKNTDTALNRAKELGRNNYQFYTPLMNAKASEKLALENSLRRALTRKEFLVHYQPQIDVAAGRIIGVEALLRWQHPDLGLVSPAEFIPMAEETGLIVPIGEWVLKTACVQVKAWQEEGLPPVRVAVNLSARQFQQKDLVEMVAGIIRETGLSAELLELEITESIAMQNADYTIEVLNELRKMGVHITLDDFGTGYSSLNYLKKFPIHTLKIDQSFVHDLTVDSNDAAIATAIIALAHSLNLDVMAEGVETEEQMEILKRQNCHKMQGFLFGRPVPAEKIRDILARQER